MAIRPEDIAEAERLKLAPRSDQRAHVAWLHDIAADPNVPDEERRDAQTRAKALVRLLKLKQMRKKR
jgi:hypothetical protein